LATREIQSRAAESEYGDLKGRLDRVAARATDLKMLLDKVSALKGLPVSQDVVVVGATSQNGPGAARRGAFLKPVVGTIIITSNQEIPGPGVTFETAPAAQVVAPCDAKVLFS